MTIHAVAEITTAKIRTAIRSYITEQLLTAANNKDFKDSDSFTQKGILDSVRVLELVNFVEESFQIQVEFEELLPTNFDSVDKLVHFVFLKTFAKSRLTTAKDAARKGGVHAFE